MNDNNVMLILSEGEAILENVFVSEIGYLMLRVHIPSENRWTTFNLGFYDEGDNIFTREILKSREKLI